MVSAVSFISIFLYFILLSVVCLGEELLQTVTDEVFGRNYTYYQIRSRGRLRLELVSHVGDADIYISESDPHPSEENYDGKSFTCGVDSVEVSSTMKRPISVSVFGHPFYSVSKYSLSVFELPKGEVDYATLDALYNSNADEASEENHDPRVSHDDQIPKDSPDEESTLLTIAVTILKILFDILL